MQQSVVHDLVLATGCDEKLAHIILEFTDEDQEKAKKIIFAIPKDIIVLAAQFSANRSGRYGLIMVVYGQTTRSFERTAVLISRNRTVPEMPVVDNIQRLFRNIEELRSRETAEEKDAKLIEEFLARPENEGPLRRILDVTAPDEVELLEFFNDILFRVLADTNLTIRFNITKIDSFQLNRGENPVPLQEESAEKPVEVSDVAEGDEKPAEGKKSEFRNESVIIMASQAIIAPVEGTPIPKFKPGDVIYTDIIDQREIALYLKKLLVEEKSGNTGKIPAVIEEMEYATETENVSIIVKFGPGIFGRIIVHRDVRIEAPGKQAEARSEEKPAGSYNWIIWVFVIAVTLLVIIMTLSKGR